MKFLKSFSAVIIVFAVFVSSLSLYGYAYKASAESVESEIGKNRYGDEYLEDYGMSRESLVSWLESHENDDYYLGTPYVGEDWQSPNGDTSYNGAPGMNCAGMVAHMVRKAGLDAERVMAAMCASNEGCYWGSGLPYDLLSGASNWYLLVQNTNIRAYYYDSFEEMFADGHAEKGDIILKYVNKPFGIGENEDNHLGIYWGDTGQENLTWQEIAVGCVIQGMAETYGMERVILIKTSPEKGITLGSSEERVTVGTEITLKAKSKGTGSDEIKWTSSDPSIAEVSADGKVTTHEIGVATVTVSSGEYHDECTIIVEGPETPDFSVKLIGSTKVRIDWSSVDGATGYKVYRSISDNCLGTMVADVSSKKTYYIDSGLSNGVQYYYTVKSYVKLNDSICDSSGKPPKSVVSRISYSVVSGYNDTDGLMVLQWKAVKDSDGYEIYWSTDGISYSLMDTVETCSVKCKEMMSGKTYYFMIKPFRNQGTDKEYIDQVRSYKFVN